MSPCYESFSSTGLYLLFAPNDRVYFWIGHEFHKRYLWDAKAMSDKKLISDSLYMRLLTIYRRDVLYEDDLDATILTIYEKSLEGAEIVAEGDETKSFIKVIRRKNAGNAAEESQSSETEGEEEDDEDDETPLVKYESPFIKKMIVPQEPRLYCLLYNS